MVYVWFASEPFSSLVGMLNGGEVGGLDYALNVSYVGERCVVGQLLVLHFAVTIERRRWPSSSVVEADCGGRSRTCVVIEKLAWILLLPSWRRLRR